MGDDSGKFAAGTLGTLEVAVLSIEKADPGDGLSLRTLTNVPGLLTLPTAVASF